MSKPPVQELTSSDVESLNLRSGQYFLLLSRALQSLPLGGGGSAAGIETQGPTYAPQGVKSSAAFEGWTRRELGRRFGVVFDFEIHRQPILTPSAGGSSARNKTGTEPRKPKPSAHKPSNPPVHIYLNLLPLAAGNASAPAYLSLTPPPTPKRKQVKIQTDDALLAGLWAGKVLPQAGYASGRLRVGGGREGGLEKVQELGSVLKAELERVRGRSKTVVNEDSKEGPKGQAPSDDGAVGAPSGQAGWGWGLAGGVRAKL